MKRFNEKKQDYPESWDFEKMLEDYGIEFLGESYPDSQPMEMDK